MDKYEVFTYKQLMHLEAIHQIISEESKSALYEEGRKDKLGKVGEKIGKEKKARKEGGKKKKQENKWLPNFLSYYQCYR